MYGKAKELIERERVFLHNTAQPLTAIVGTASFLLEMIKRGNCSPSELLENLTIMDDAGKNLLQRYQEERSYLGGKEAEAKERNNYSREEFLQYFSGHIIPAARKKGIEYVIGEFQLPDSEISLDESFMYNAISNLVENARDAGAKKMINDYWTDSGFFFMSFKDDGQGMDAETLRKCLHMGFTTKTQGSGIGLGYLDREVRASGGKVEVQSEPGKGAKIIIAQPLSMYYPTLNSKENSSEIHGNKK
jgi:signal transduction histidine kinase